MQVEYYSASTETWLPGFIDRVYEDGGAVELELLGTASRAAGKRQKVHTVEYALGPGRFFSGASPSEGIAGVDIDIVTGDEEVSAASWRVSLRLSRAASHARIPLLGAPFQLPSSFLALAK